jgi:hypothetical protein
MRRSLSFNRGGCFMQAMAVCGQPGNISSVPLLMLLEGDIQLAADCCSVTACGDSICRIRIDSVGT